MGFFDRQRKRVREDAAAGQITPDAANILDAIGAHLDLITSVEQHIRTHFGEPFGVIRQHDRNDAIDLFVMPANEDVNHATIITSGMSRRPMNGAPEGATRAELLISLPRDWPLDGDALREEHNWWPFRLLGHMANLPRAQDTWIGVGHAIRNGDPPDPYADNTALCAALFLRPFFTPPGFNTLEVEGDTVNFYGLFLLHADEVQYKIDHTNEEFFELLANGGVTEIVNLTRPSAV